MVYLSLSRENTLYVVSVSRNLFKRRHICGLRKQLSFRSAIGGFPAKWHLRNERRDSILMTCHYPDLGSASDWLKLISFAVPTIRSTTQIWLVTRHQYRVSAVISQTSFRGETSGGDAKCRLFCQANILSDLFSNSDDSLYGNWSRRMLTRFSRITRAWSSTLGQFSRGLCALYTTRQNKMVNWQNPYLSGLVNLCDACLIEMRIWWVQAQGILSWLNTR